MDEAKETKVAEIAKRIRVIDGPPGSCGFRSGRWTYEIDGRRGKVFSSVSHNLDLNEQNAQVRQDAARQEFEKFDAARRETEDAYWAEQAYRQELRDGCA